VNHQRSYSSMARFLRLGGQTREEELALGGLVEHVRG